MKNRNKTLSAILAILVLSALTACGTVANAPPQPSPPAQSSSIAETPSNAESATAESVSAVPTVEENPIVYMTTDISPAGLLNIYRSLGRELTGSVAVKISTGEPGSHFLDANLIKDLVQTVDGTIVECNTAIAAVDIMDANGSVGIPVEGGTRLTKNLVGANFVNYDSYMILSHFKGHRMGGFGGAIKNMSIGIASAEGKCLVHSAGVSKTDRMLSTTPQDDFLETMAESAKSVADYLGENIVYINVMNHLSVDCDCIAYGAAPSMADIGILASLDPVALDQACVDLVYAAPDGADLIERMESRNAIHAIEHAVKIGFGNREYQLVRIDD